MPWDRSRSGRSIRSGYAAPKVRMSASNSPTTSASWQATPRPCQTAQPFPGGPVTSKSRFPTDSSSSRTAGPLVQCTCTGKGIPAKKASAAATSSAFSAASAITSELKPVSGARVSRMRASAGLLNSSMRHGINRVVGLWPSSWLKAMAL